VLQPRQQNSCAGGPGLQPVPPASPISPTSTTMFRAGPTPCCPPEALPPGCPELLAEGGGDRAVIGGARLRIELVLTAHPPRSPCADPQAWRDWRCWPSWNWGGLTERERERLVRLQCWPRSGSGDDFQERTGQGFAVVEDSCGGQCRNSCGAWIAPWQTVAACGCHWTSRRCHYSWMGRRSRQQSHHRRVTAGDAAPPGRLLTSTWRMWCSWWKNCP
jgi:hypothetical protein